MHSNLVGNNIFSIIHSLIVYSSAVSHNSLLKHTKKKQLFFLHKFCIIKSQHLIPKPFLSHSYFLHFVLLILKLHLVVKKEKKPNISNPHFILLLGFDFCPQKNRNFGRKNWELWIEGTKSTKLNIYLV